VNLDYAGDGDEVRLTVEANKVTAISLAKERK
jgi:hypothetical protein